ncbi:hypothetical protein H4684_001451 [Desulfomicrobium macestii]|uniref:Uncharacterized protein n=1 Tax=Desulfomicrobium macestii TaxID=90731 RepID=A0ABR9H281_9BACT|nr:hypothetical protein [Desulfomicrobium macestii]
MASRYPCLEPGDPAPEALAKLRALWFKSGPSKR